MASLPPYVRVLFEYPEGFDPSVERTEMERGPAKERVLNSRVMMDPTATFWFKSYLDAMAFEDWYFDTIGRVGWFDFYHPLRRKTVLAKFVAGDIGQLVLIGPGGNPCQRQVRLEYMR